ARTADEQLETLIEPTQERLGRQYLDSGRGQLDSQWEPVEARADLGDSGGRCVGHLEVGLDCSGPLDEQTYRLILAQVLRGRPWRVREAQRRYGHLMFAVDAQRCSTGDQHLEQRAGDEQLCELAGGGEQLLEVI